MEKVEILRLICIEIPSVDAAKAMMINTVTPKHPLCSETRRYRSRKPYSAPFAIAIMWGAERDV